MMTKAEVISAYSMEELIPIVGKLAQHFTSYASSSVTYERARQLMEAVIFCIAHADYGNSTDGKEGTKLHMPGLEAEEAYKLGYESVIRKVKKTKEKYNELILSFDYYGNENYGDTIEKALPGFFMYYDVKYAPVETIITMDYPIIGLDMTLEGIDMIEQYIDAIIQEQQYLKKFPREYVIAKLYKFHPRYEKEFFNIKEIIDM